MKVRRLFILLPLLILPALVFGQSDSDDQAHRSLLPTTPLAELLDVVARKSDRTFAIDAIVHPDIVAGQISKSDITYTTLLVILRNNGLAAATMNGVTSVVPLRIIRQLPLPVLFEDDDSIDEEEWIMRVVEVKNAPAASLVPILRPIMPQAGHLAAHSLSNSLLIVDRYANAQHLIAIISKLDANTPPQGE